MTFVLARAQTFQLLPMCCGALSTYWAFASSGHFAAVSLCFLVFISTFQPQHHQIPA